MLDLFSQFATDAQAELNGVRVPYQGVVFIIARSGNKRYGKLLAEKFKKHQVQLELKDDAADELSDKLMAEIMAETILLGWEGDIGYKGEKLAYSKENAVKVLMHPDFRAFISKLADDREKFRADAIDEKVGNSAAS
jgi:hypothetical protein